MKAMLQARARWTLGLIPPILLVCSSAASAMQELGEKEKIDETIASPLFSLPVRVGVFVALLLVAWAFGFYVLFPWLLNRKSAMRPLQAYGLTIGLIWVTWCGLALLVFQDMLVLKSLSMDGPAGEFLRNWALICAISLGALIGFMILRAIFGGRSERFAS